MQGQYTKTNRRGNPKSKAASFADVVSLIVQEARKRGLSWFTPMHASAMAGSFAQETGNFRSDVLNFQVRGDNGTAHGLAQWRGPRYRNLLTFAKQKNINPTSLPAQVSFAFEEALGARQFRDGGAALAFQQMARARNIDQAAVAFIHFERPAGYTQRNPGGANDAQNRIRLSKRAAQEFSGTGGPNGDGSNDTALNSGRFGRGEFNEFRGIQGDSGFGLASNQNFGQDISNIQQPSNPADRFGIQAERFRNPAPVLQFGDVEADPNQNLFDAGSSTLADLAVPSRSRFGI